MEKKMSVMGIGHKAGIVVAVYLAITVVISYLLSPAFKITTSSYDTLVKVGVIMAIIGFSINMIAAVQMLIAHKNGKLATKGLYALFLNPMYTMQLLVTVPGLILLFNSWLVLSTVIVALITVKVFVREEYEYLEAKFGDEYREYRKKVLFKFL